MSNESQLREQISVELELVLTDRDTVLSDGARRAIQFAINHTQSQQSPAVPVSDERKAFEEWAKSKGLITVSNGMRAVNSMCDIAFSAWQARALLALKPEQVPDIVLLTERIAEMLTGTCHCHRVWRAWHDGTMSQDDFSPVEESDTPREVAEMIANHFPSVGNMVASNQLAAHPAPLSQNEHVGIFCGMRRTPEGTREFWGMIEDKDNPPAENSRLYTHPAPVAPVAQVPTILEKLARFQECVEDAAGVDIGQDWIDALTTIGLLRKCARGRWEMTDAAQAILSAPKPPEPAQAAQK